MIIRWTNQKGVLMAGKTVDMHRAQALEEVICGNATLVDQVDNIERQVIAEKIEARKASQMITVLHVTPEDLDQSNGEIKQP